MTQSCLVVISHYNVWATDQLIALLDQTKSVPAGHPFRCRVVVNQAEPKPLDLPSRHADVEILYRENTGYNIGAWDLGWRQDPLFDIYLFLQEECVILKAGWLRAYIRRLSNPKVGLVGESMDWKGMTWARLARYFQMFPFDSKIDGHFVPISEGLRISLERLGIDPGSTGEHLQSLVFCTRRAVLEATDGFLIGHTYAEATTAEMAASKRVQALGLRTCEVGFRSFSYINHPQWTQRKANLVRTFLRVAEPYLPINLMAWAKTARYRFQNRKRRPAPAPPDHEAVAALDVTP